jgi:hypothetical protein
VTENLQDDALDEGLEDSAELPWEYRAACVSPSSMD